MTSTPIVLLLEADITARHPLAEFLRDCGYKVVEAATTDEARTLFESELVFDAALMDIKAPGNEAAFSLSQWLRVHRPGTDVILAGTIEAEAKKAGELCSRPGLAARPYDHAQVLALIRQLRAARARKS